MNEAQQGGLIAELRGILRCFDRDNTVTNLFNQTMGKGVRVYITYSHAERIRELIKAREEEESD